MCHVKFKDTFMGFIKVVTVRVIISKIHLYYEYYNFIWTYNPYVSICVIHNIRLLLKNNAIMTLHSEIVVTRCTKMWQVKVIRKQWSLLYPGNAIDIGPVFMGDVSSNFILVIEELWKLSNSTMTSHVKISSALLFSNILFSN